MRIKTTKEELLKAVTTAARAVPQKATVPIYETLLFAGNDNGLSVTGTDGDIIITASCEAEAEGAACISAKTIVELVKVLPDTEVTIESDDKTAKVSWGIGHSEIPVHPMADFPDVTKQDGDTAEVDAQTLATAIAHTLPHVATDILRPQLTGVHFNPMDGYTDLIGTDSHTICVYPVETKVPRAFTVSAKSMAVVRDAASEVEKVTVIIGTRVSFVCGGTTVSSPEIVGKFPDYNRVIPTGYDNTLKADAKSFARQIRRVAIFSNKASNHIKLELNPLASTVYAQDLGFGVSGQESLEVEYEGENLTIGFKHDFLLKSIAVLDGDNVTVQFGDSRRAALVTSDGDPARCVVMPVAVQ